MRGKTRYGSSQAIMQRFAKQEGDRGQGPLPFYNAKFKVGWWEQHQSYGLLLQASLREGLTGVDKIGYHFNEFNLLHGGWVRYGRQADGQTLKNSNEVKSSHIVLPILKLKEYF